MNGGVRGLAALLEARSVAVVGASARPGSFGRQLVAQLFEGGYRGAVHLVNPRLAARPLLDGARGAPPADLAAVADAIVHLSALAADLDPLLAALDVNPLVAGPSGCVAVDALVVQAAG